MWQFARADVPSRHNRREIVAAGADDRLQHLSIVSFLVDLVSCRRPAPHRARPRRGVISSAHARADVCACSRVSGHPRCMGWKHEPALQPTIIRQRIPRSAGAADEGGPERARPPRPPSTCERVRGWGGPRPLVRDPHRGQRLDHGRGPAVDLHAGVRGTGPVAPRGARRRGQRPIATRPRAADTGPRRRRARDTGPRRRRARFGRGAALVPNAAAEVTRPRR